MTALDDRMLPRIKRIIADKGREVLFRDIVFKSGTYDTSTGAVTGATEGNCNAMITPLDMDVRKYDPLSEIPKAKAVTMIAGDGLKFTPRNDGKIDISDGLGCDTVTWTIVAIRVISPGEEVGAYMLFLGA